MTPYVLPKRKIRHLLAWALYVWRRYTKDIHIGVLLMRMRLTPINWFTLLALIAAGLILGLPPDPHTVQQLHTSDAAYRLALFALLIPYILIWYAGFYAFSKLQEYSRQLKGAKNEAAFQRLTLGMGTLAFSLVIPTIVSLILNNIAMHVPPFKPAAVIISNYLGLFPGMAAFLLLYSGARMLVNTVRGKKPPFDVRWRAPWFLLLSVVFSHLTIENEYRSNPYHLGVWLLLVTFIVPYLYGWMIGLLCAYDLRQYARTVKGLLYRRAVWRLASGVVVAIAGSIAIQFVNVTIGQRVSSSLVAVLLVDYGLLIIVGTGLALIAFGAKRLKLIEEI